MSYLHESVVEFLLRGYGLHGCVFFLCFFFCFGSGSNDFSLGSIDRFNPFGNYRLISRVFPRQSEPSADFAVHPGFSIFKVRNTYLFNLCQSDEVIGLIRISIRGNRRSFCAEVLVRRMCVRRKHARIFSATMTILFFFSVSASAYKYQFTRKIFIVALAIRGVCIRLIFCIRAVRARMTEQDDLFRSAAKYYESWNLSRQMSKRTRRCANANQRRLFCNGHV